jgi:hypothetical protein
MNWYLSVFAGDPAVLLFARPVRTLAVAEALAETAIAERHDCVAYVRGPCGNVREYQYAEEPS